jgi:hypothetical protein
MDGSWGFVQNKDYYYGCRNTYLFVQTRWQFVSGKLFTRICFSWYHTVTFTESVIIRTNIRWLVIQNTLPLIQTVIVINEIYFNQRKILVPKFTYLIRYLLKEIKRCGLDCKGTFNGLPIPWTDYWLVIKCPEDLILIKFKSH